MQWREKRVLVTGGAGFLGSFVVEKLRERGCKNIAVPRSKEYDLRDRDAIIRLYTEAQPHIVIHLAAVVGGIGANRMHPGRFFYDNAIMGIQLMELDSGEFCIWPKLNARKYPCTLWMPSQRVPQKGYPLAQAHCTPFAYTPGFYVWLTPPSDQAAMAACAAHSRCTDCVGSAA